MCVKRNILASAEKIVEADEGWWGGFYLRDLPLSDPPNPPLFPLNVFCAELLKKIKICFTFRFKMWVFSNVPQQKTYLKLFHGFLHVQKHLLQLSLFWPTLQLWPLSAEALEGHLEAFLQSLTLVLVLLQSCLSNIQHMHDINVSNGPHPPLPGSLVSLLGSFLPEALWDVWPHSDCYSAVWSSFMQMLVFFCLKVF